MFRMRAGRLGVSTLTSSIALWALSSLLFVSVAFADALVVVNVRDASGRPVDGTVTLTAELGGQAYTCQTHAGACEIPKVPGGSYKASVVPTGSSQATPPRAVMIPPTGKVSLIVSTAALVAAP